MKNYFFFVRHENDFDNLLPIIYFLSNSSSHRILVIVYQNSKKISEIILNHKKFFKNDIEIYYLKPSLLSLIDSFKRKIKLKKNTNTNYVRLINWIDSKSSCKKNIFIFDRQINLLLKKLKAIYIGKNNIFVSLPHGPMTNKNRMLYYHSNKKVISVNDVKNLVKYYDWLIYTDNLQLKIDEDYGIKISKQNKKKILVLGSIRYSSQWLEKISIKKIKKSKKQIIGIFMKKREHNVNYEEFQRSLNIFANYKDIKFIIKPHPREKFIKSDTYANNISFDSNISSSNLIQMSNAILFYGGTGIILEALQRNKIVGCIEYLDTNISFYEYFNACHILKTRDELFYFLDNYKKLAPKNLGVSKLINALVFGGMKKNVVSNYLNFFLKL